MTQATILGFDPGSCQMGYGVLKRCGSGYKTIAMGAVPIRGKQLTQKLAHIYQSCIGLIQTHQPVACAVETLFLKQFTHGALILAHARGALLAALGSSGLPIFEYEPCMIKSRVAGFGRADKLQLAAAVRLQVQDVPEHLNPNASDALAVALCHCLSVHSNEWLNQRFGAQP